ncbi:3-keto-5-aminohexanoate cleavage protein [Thalassobius sp. I31.1]|uniref:3-keto-5-aminohexanoate cleavage protein n=1 Tax=Thalassobius sp. I31.1 TaxID=2109912 RepID=UPI000D1B285F|nr:3-keto-5-aminohexanoate cleavage protein [Thalassobius sp. I31.1]
MSRIFSVTVAPNGARRGKTDHPALPVTNAEIAQTAASCHAAGAQATHLHVRDDNGQHSLDAGRYREAMAAVQTAAPGMDIQITTESAGIYDVAAQYDCLAALTPAAASVSVREMARDEATAARLYALAAEAGTDLQHILYNAGDIEQLAVWMNKGIVPPQMRSAIFVLGQYNPAIHAQPSDLQIFLRAGHDLNLDWTICAFGPNELACARAALATGGNVRVGFENNLLRPDGTPARDNAELVALTVNEGLDLGLTPSTQLPKAC